MEVIDVIEFFQLDYRRGCIVEELLQAEPDYRKITWLLERIKDRPPEKQLNVTALAEYTVTTDEQPQPPPKQKLLPKKWDRW